MSRIEAGLHVHHAQIQSQSPVSAASHPDSSGGRGTTGSLSLEAHFAQVNSVVAGSPADEAGLRAGDKVRRFGNVNWMNHERLSKVADTVQRNEGVGRPLLVWSSNANKLHYLANHFSQGF